MASTTKEAMRIAREKLAVANQRRRQRDKAANDKRKITVAGSSYLLGRMSQDPESMLSKVPELFGSRMLTLAIAGMVAGEYVDGVAGDVAEGIGEAAMAIGLYQLGAGQDVSGDVGLDGRPERDEIPEWTDGGEGAIRDL